MSVDLELGDVKLTFLTPPGPAGSFSFPMSPDVGIIPSLDVLSKVDPTMSGRRGRGYKLSTQEMDCANKRLLMRKKYVN
ncbi:MAG: hypothetical protein GY696_08125 [Gammaproteobacteria bacterium]|nr:hypothetical protein [Gammaproteobacteria bacterium]